MFVTNQVTTTRTQSPSSCPVVFSCKAICRGPGEAYRRRRNEVSPVPTEGWYCDSVYKTAGGYLTASYCKEARQPLFSSGPSVKLLAQSVIGLITVEDLTTVWDDDVAAINTCWRSDNSRIEVNWGLLRWLTRSFFRSPMPRCSYVKWSIGPRKPMRRDTVNQAELYSRKRRQTRLGTSYRHLISLSNISIYRILP